MPELNPSNNSPLILRSYFTTVPPKRFHPSPDDFDGPLTLINTIHEDRLPLEETCPLSTTYPPVEKASVVVETSGCIHAATVFIQETLETIVDIRPTSVQQALKRKLKQAKEVTAGVVESPAKVARLQFTDAVKDTVSCSTSALPKPGGSTSPAEKVVQAPSVLPEPASPMEDLHRLPDAHPQNSIRSLLDTPYPFLHSFNLVLHKIIPRRPLVSSTSTVGDETMDVDVDSHRPLVIRPSCRLLASIGNYLCLFLFFIRLSYTHAAFLSFILLALSYTTSETRSLKLCIC
ncbi:unnamed protein product [Dibothriocephalus latus]|uniref:Uncharacterized protein n=1 Tax=Dibothriocephalus latus TaxID=60516 RepID=A0A3P7MWI8_DIBLA|nr:unnamed protein product [Dibothriocephalus latus]